MGGHCIGVDPYYLAQKAQEYGYNPEIILAGRRLNDGMGNYVASEIIKCMIKKNIHIKGAKVLILGVTFKENCPDVRNTKVIDVVYALQDYGIQISIHDPWANEEEVKREYGLVSKQEAPKEQFDAIVLTVAHREFESLNIKQLKLENSVVYDVKNILSRDMRDSSL